MNRIILLLLFIFTTPFANAFIAKGDQIICSGFANQFQFKIGDPIKDSEGQLIQPTHFRGEFENLKPSESQSGKVLFIENSPDQFAIRLADENLTVGHLEDYGQLAFSRIIRDGSKHLTNCYFREL